MYARRNSISAHCAAVPRLKHVFEVVYESKGELWYMSAEGNEVPSYLGQRGIRRAVHTLPLSS